MGHAGVVTVTELLGTDRLLALSKATTVYVTVLEDFTKFVSERVVRTAPILSAVTTPALSDRLIVYPFIPDPPTLSVEAFQDRLTCPQLATVAIKPVGTEGAIRS